jgi:archaellum biogenesis ATPase FlaH
MQTARIERTILSNLLNQEEYVRKVLPFLKAEYFHDSSEKIVFTAISEALAKYNKLPSSEQLIITLNEAHNVPEPEFNKAVEIINSLNEQSADLQWMTDATEKFCKDKAIYNAIADGIQIIEGRDKNRTPDALPSLLSDALSVSFDPNVGHDYFEQSNDRFDFYHTKEEKIPFNLKYFDLITKGGLPSKTLNVALAGTGVGKSLFMCHLAANYMMHNKNVLYITMEMAEERIAERIDANLLNMDIQTLEELPKSMFDKKLASLQRETHGKLIVKEYPTATAHKGHFDALINELALKKSFKPDAIFIDYLNICASQRFKAGASQNSYTIIKSIAEELRGLAVEHNVPIISATQTTRQGFSSTDIGLEDTSESFGLPATCDFMFALISNEELEQHNQILVKQLKNRYNDPTKYKRFVLGIDRAKMQLYDVEESAQEDLVENMKPKAPDTVQVVEQNGFDKLKEQRNDKKYKDFSTFKI